MGIYVNYSVDANEYGLAAPCQLLPPAQAWSSSCSGAVAAIAAGGQGRKGDRNIAIIIRAHRIILAGAQLTVKHDGFLIAKVADGGRMVDACRILAPQVVSPACGKWAQGIERPGTPGNTTIGEAGNAGAVRTPVRGLQVDLRVMMPMATWLRLGRHYQARPITKR